VIQPQSEKWFAEIIDAHVHLSEREDDRADSGSRDQRAEIHLNELLDTMRRLEIMRGLLLSPPMRGGLRFRIKSIIGLCAKSGGMLAPVITAEPTAKEVKTAISLAEENKEGG